MFTIDPIKKLEVLETVKDRIAQVRRIILDEKSTIGAEDTLERGTTLSQQLSILRI